MQPSLLLFHDLAMFGFYVPPGLLWAVLAVVPYALARWLVARLGLDRFIWHKPLFNLALYMLVAGGGILMGNLIWP